MSHRHRISRATFLKGAAGSGLALAASAAPAPARARARALRSRGARVRADHFVPSNPDNIVWGGFPIDRPPVLTIGSGQTVRIDTLSHQGATNTTMDPVTYLGHLGVKPGEVLQDVQDFWSSIPNRAKYGGGHLLTGPIYIDGAAPGDTLEVQVLDLNTRVPYGLNTTSPTSGIFADTYPGYRPGDKGLDIPAPPPGAPAGLYPGVRQHLYRTTKIEGRDVVVLEEGVNVPLHPHMGIMGVAAATGVFVPRLPNDPPPADGVQSSTPPGPFGGNLDVRDLTVGSRLYLPVFQPGARFYTGDPHAGMGNGEVSGNAVEQSLTGVFRFVLHKKSIVLPRAEDDQNYILIGIDHDLDRALTIATRQMIDFLVAEEGLSVARAFSLASTAGDFQISEAVDGTQVVSGKLAKTLFSRKARLNAGPAPPA
jgi:acetamidase/formamidase